MSAVARVEVRRWYAAAPDVVSCAISDPALYPRWLCPSARFRLEVAEHDLRVGGRYRLVYRPLDGSDPSAVVGEYRVVELPARLVFTGAGSCPTPMPAPTRS